jgi:Kef-type K+ transport system membrane component KefB/Trk K+ transport system NAD-binding subunit
MEQNLQFLPLLLVLLLAFVIPPVLSRIRWMPVVVGEILAGIIIGRSGLNLIQADSTLDFLAEIGLALLMFLSGLEIDFSLLQNTGRGRRRRSQPFLFAGFSFVLTVSLAGLLAWLLMKKGLAQDPWMIALILSTTSLGIVVPVLKERNMTSGTFGQTMLLAALVADFLTMFLITIYVAIQSRGLNLEILLVGVLFVAALITYRVGIFRVKRSSLDRALEEISFASSLVKVQGAVALLLAFVILAKFLGSEMILGAFLAGAVLSLLSRPEDEPTRHRLDAIGFGFFIPLFFMTVGIRFDFPSLLANKAAWVLTPVFLGAAFLIKILPSLVFRFFLSWRECFAGGILLSARLSLIIAASGIGLRLGIINEAANAAFILLAALSATLSPLIFNGLLPARREPKQTYVLIYGAGDMGLQVARELTEHGERVCLLELDHQRASHARQSGFKVIQKEGLLAAFEKEDLSSIRSLLALSPDDSSNLAVCREALSLGIKHLVALVNDAARLSEFHDLGVQTFTPAMYRATILALMARNPDLFSLLTSTRRDHQIQELTLSNPLLTGKPLRHLSLGGNILVLSIRRDRDLLIPHGDTILEFGDHLTLLGHSDALRELMNRFEKQTR